MPEYIDDKGCICVRDFKQQSRDYQKYEFCYDSGCLNFNGVKCDICDRGSNFCTRTAKEFHEWLEDNEFKIVKE